MGHPAKAASQLPSQVPECEGPGAPSTPEGLETLRTAGQEPGATTGLEPGATLFNQSSDCGAEQLP
jgi:hypothetical protein